MHFFHPIQQCAQQVYHTALPLSPTSSLQKHYLPKFADDQPSHVIAFIGAPSTWGLLLRTIDIRPMELTSIATSGQWIIAACGDIVKIYDAVTGVLKQSLSPSKPVKDSSLSRWVHLVLCTSFFCDYVGCTDRWTRPHLYHIAT